MWIQVRTMDGRKNVRIDDLSKLTKIEELREMLVEPFEAEVEKQRLFYRGKQVRENGSICVHCGTWFERVACRSIVHGGIWDTVFHNHKRVAELHTDMLVL